jgi:hypothetical protein
VRLAAILFVLALSAVAPTNAAGQDDRAAAQHDFKEGQRAFAAGDFRRAGTLFEEAYRKKPHPSVLWNAARSWEHAGESAQAANLYGRYLREAEPGARDRDSATNALKNLGGKLGRIDVTGVGAPSAQVDGKELVGASRWVVPGEHVVTGRANNADLRKTVTLTAGQVLSVALDPPEEKKEPALAPQPSQPPSADRKPEGSGLPWIIVVGGGVLTATAGGLTIWSGLDTNAKRRAFDDAPTQSNKDDGLERQLRTNILLGTTIGLAALTGLAAVFTNWSAGPFGSSSSGIAFAPHIASGGGGLLMVARTR